MSYSALLYISSNHLKTNIPQIELLIATLPLKMNPSHASLLHLNEW